jgi:hypothetical protein
MALLSVVLLGLVVFFGWRTHHWRERSKWDSRANASLIEQLAHARADAARYWRDRERVKRDLRRSYESAVDTAIFNLDRIAAGSTPDHYVFTDNELSEMARASSEQLQRVRELAAYDPSDAPFETTIH